MRARVFRRRWRRPVVVVALMVAAVVLAVVAVLMWWNLVGWRPPRPGWAGTEQAGWIAGVAAAVLALASFVADRRDARGDTGARQPEQAGTVRVGRVPRQASWWQDRHTRTNLAWAGRTTELTQVLSGLGGMGKTQLAARFARDLDIANQLDVLVWITATSRDAIVAGYAEASYVLHVCGSEAAPPVAAERLLSWLEHTDRRWLIVLDNLDTPADAAGLWPPDNRNGRTVITTRSRDPILHTDGRALVPVDLFSPGEAAGYLTLATGSAANMDQVAADLGYLPLAVAQAAAFIGDRRIDAVTYRQQLADRRHTLEQLSPPTMPDDYRSTIAATWSLSITAANTQPPRNLAQPLLELAALLDPNGIPADLFTTAAVTAYMLAAVGREPTSKDSVDALRNLHRLHLIDHDLEAGTVRVHGLVQRAVRDTINNDWQATLAATAADALLELWPEMERDAGHAQALRANTVALRTSTHNHLCTSDGAHSVLFRAASSLGNVGLVTAAVTAYKRLLADVLPVMGPEHPDTLTTRHHLAYWRGQAGDPTGAATTLEQLLDDQMRILGPEHPHTLTTRHDLALWRGQAGDPAGAATAFQQLLSDRLRVLGPEHPDSLTTRHGLAYWRGEVGDPAGAATALQQLLDDRLRVLGPEHPHTLATRHDLAYWRGQAGDPTGAATTLEQLLDDQMRILGPEHPHTLTTRHNLHLLRQVGSQRRPQSVTATVRRRRTSTD